MHNPHYDDMFFTPHYIRGLKEEIRGTVESQMSTTVHQALVIAKIQQGVHDRSKTRYQRNVSQPKPYMAPRVEPKPATPLTSLWKDRQLRDYRKANGLCFNCGDKFVPGHLEVCPKRNKPQVNALVINDLDRELSDEVLNQLAAEDTLHEDFCQLSLHAISSVDNTNCIKLKARV